MLVLNPQMYQQMLKTSSTLSPLFQKEYFGPSSCHVQIVQFFVSFYCYLYQSCDVNTIHWPSRSFCLSLNYQGVNSINREPQRRYLRPIFLHLGLTVSDDDLVIRSRQDIAAEVPPLIYCEPGSAPDTNQTPPQIYVLNNVYLH